MKLGKWTIYSLVILILNFIHINFIRFDGEIFVLISSVAYPVGMGLGIKAVMEKKKYGWIGIIGNMLFLLPILPLILFRYG
ncbi:hypothetical protein [Desmospora profundinema]|uniref:Uncharacterized protein n=1 Tax=Desmospora profundinema TaxID=1571184 RepID=A0ABU1IK94_9BACL|nr:hypothetical protein [Desmospora profundinema]MDR6225178.1 hypothetical protein [Desmospora profundinema]